MNQVDITEAGRELAAHTPGPWTLGRKTKCRVCINGVQWFELAKVVVRTSEGYGEPRRSPEGEANARLIALAPELFEYVESSAMNGCATAQALIAKAKP